MGSIAGLSRFLSRFHLRPPCALCRSNTFTSSRGHSAPSGYCDDVRTSSLHLCPSCSLSSRDSRPASSRDLAPSSGPVLVACAESRERSRDSLNLGGQSSMLLLQQMNHTTHVCHWGTPSSLAIVSRRAGDQREYWHTLTISEEASLQHLHYTKEKRDRPPPRLIGPVCQPPMLSGSGATVDSDSRHGNGPNVGSTPLQRVMDLLICLGLGTASRKQKNYEANDSRPCPK